MKIALIEPPYHFNPDPENLDMFHLGGIAYIGAVLKKQGHDIKVIDFMHDKHASLDQILGCDACDAVGLASYINSYSFQHPCILA